VNPDKPFVLRVDASGYAIGASLEQLEDEERLPTVEDVRARKTVPIAFLSRKLTEGQRKWVPREQETYAIIVALQKWQSWIGLQPVLVLTDHQAIESWAKEVLDTPSGPIGRRARWHQILSRFDITVGYIPGKENDIADILSRWAYPASQAFRDISVHGNEKDMEEVEAILRQEKEDEKDCMAVIFRRHKNPNGKIEKMLVNNEPFSDLSSSETSLSDDEDDDDEDDEDLSHEQENSFHILPVPRFEFTKPGEGKSGGRRSRTNAPPRVPAKQSRSADREGEVHTPPPQSSHGSERESEEQGLPRAQSASPGLHAEPEEEDQGAPQQPREESAPQVHGEGAPHPDTQNPQHLINEGGDEEVEEGPYPYYQDVANWDCVAEYKKCPGFGMIWHACHTPELQWPRAIKIFGNRMYNQEKLCVPWGLQRAYIRDYHAFLGHVGPDRLWYHFEPTTDFASMENAKKFVYQVMGQCETCQASQRAFRLAGPMEPTPVPPRIMTHVAIDLFHMGLVKHDSETFDTMVVCVDRHSGWIIALPCLGKGLTGPKVAQMLLKEWRILEYHL
jgi:hypothetical protein